jgi:Uma2 family endonuclease
MIRTLRKPVVRVGPEDDGRRMSLDDFDRAIGREGYLYELSKGVIQVVNVPGGNHANQFQGVITFIGGGGEAKLLIGPAQSERHPDVVVYTTPQPKGGDLWSLWVPDIVVEIVSPGSAKRDYEEKPGEYLTLGVKEYWIVDAAKKKMTVLARWRGLWKQTVVKPPKKYVSIRLPGFRLDLKRVLAAAK